MIRRALLAIALLGTSVTSRAACQQRRLPLNAEQRLEVVDSIASALNLMYVFPDVAKLIDADLHASVKRGEFFISSCSDLSNW